MGFEKKKQFAALLTLFHTFLSWYFLKNMQLHWKELITVDLKTTLIPSAWEQLRREVNIWNAAARCRMAGVLQGMYVVCSNADKKIRIQMTFSQPVDYSGHFLPFKWWGRKQRNGCVQDTADHSGQRKSHWKHRLWFHVNSPALGRFPFIIKQSYTGEQPNDPHNALFKKSDRNLFFLKTQHRGQIVLLFYNYRYNKSPINTLLWK